MERKVARAGGVRSEEETRALNARIEKLTIVLESVNSENGMLLDQVRSYFTFLTIVCIVCVTVSLSLQQIPSLWCVGVKSSRLTCSKVRKVSQSAFAPEDNSLCDA